MPGAPVSIWKEPSHIFARACYNDTVIYNEPNFGSVKWQFKHERMTSSEEPGVPMLSCFCCQMQTLLALRAAIVGSDLSATAIPSEATTPVRKAIAKLHRDGFAGCCFCRVEVCSRYAAWTATSLLSRGFTCRFSLRRRVIAGKIASCKSRQRGQSSRCCLPSDESGAAEVSISKKLSQFINKVPSVT